MRIPLAIARNQESIYGTFKRSKFSVEPTELAEVSQRYIAFGKLLNENKIELISYTFLETDLHPALSCTGTLQLCLAHYNAF